nr:replication initiation protein [uncultured Amphritea sp.]
MKSSKSPIVTFSNRLVDAPFSIRVSIHTLRIILMAVAKINSLKNHTEQNTLFKITPTAYAETFSCSTSTAYRVLSDNTDSLSQLASLMINESAPCTEISWFKAAHYSQAKIGNHISARVLTLNFSEKILTELTGIRGKYTSIHLDQIKPLTHPQSIFLYIQAKRAHNQSEYYRIKKGKKTSFKLQLDYYRELLALKDKYKEFKEFKRRILKPAINEINKHTDIEISIDPIRTGRFISDLTITVQDTPLYIRASGELDHHKKTRHSKACKEWKVKRADLIEDKKSILSQGPAKLYVEYLNELADLHHSLGNPGKVASIEHEIRTITAGHDSDYLMEEDF